MNIALGLAALGLAVGVAALLGARSRPRRAVGAILTLFAVAALAGVLGRADLAVTALALGGAYGLAALGVAS